MNDIKILEELIERFDAPGGGHIIPTELSFDERNAIENLIKRNKELKEMLVMLNERFGKKKRR